MFQVLSCKYLAAADSDQAIQVQKLLEEFSELSSTIVSINKSEHDD